MTGNPVATSYPHSGHATLLPCHSWKVFPVPVARHSYDSEDIWPDAWHGWQAILTVFLTFVQRPNRSKRSARMSNALCSLSGWVEATRPSLA